MKSFLLLVIAIFQLQNIYSQEKIYFDKDWKTTTKENAAYYRIIAKENDSLYAVKDYYINGTLQMDGYTTSLEKDIFHGTVNWYNEKGKKTITRNYKKGVLDGLVIDYRGPFSTRCQYKNYMPYNGTIYNNNKTPAQYSDYTNGQKITSNSYYKNSTQTAIKTSYYYYNKYQSYYPLKEVFYDKNNKIIGTLNYHKNQSLTPDNGTKIMFYLENNQAVSIKSKVNYANAVLEGEAITYHKNGKKWLKGSYKNGKKYQGDFLESKTQRHFENGILTEKISYDKKFTVLTKMQYKDGKPYEGTEYIYNGIVTYKKGKLIKRKDFYDAKKHQIKKITTCSNDVCTIEWYNRQGRFLGTGISKKNAIINGLELAYNKLIFYKNGMKNGIQKEYKSELLNELIAEALYKNDTVIYTKTKKPKTDTFYRCDYKNNEPYQGIEYASDYKNTKYYENGKLTKEVAYIKDEKTKELTVQLIQFYDTSSKYKSVRKEIQYVHGKEYMLTYKNALPYNGMSWFLNTLFTYKNGKKEGLYQVYDTNKKIIVEKGNYVNNQIQGKVTYTPIETHKYPFITHKPSICEFVDSKPYNGTVSTKNETTHYKNGKKTGVCATYFSAYTNILARKITYKNGKKEGEESVYLIHNKILKGINKEDKPFSGEFYNLKNNVVETYVEGKKQGQFIVFNDYKLMQTQQYDKGKLLSEKTINLIKNDSIIGEGIYKNNKPYQGKFVRKQKGYQKYIVTSYKKGVKEGVEKLIHADYKGITTLTSTTYKKGQKEGAYKSNYYFSNKRRQINGVYKKNKPFNGEFVTNNDEDFHVISRFKKGLKEGYETYYFKGKIDSLLYKLGKPIEGIQYELTKEVYTNNILKHHYKNGKKYKTILRDNTEITYTNTGFTITNIKYYYKSGYDKVSVVFKNKKHKKGTISYYVENRSIGKFEFKNGILLKGKMAYNAIIDKKINGFEIVVQENIIKTTLKSHKKFKINAVLFFTNKIPTKITYLDYQLLLDGLMDLSDKNSKFKIKQYLLDGTLISEATYGNKKKSGTLINFKELKEGNITYSIDYYKKGVDKPIRLKDLNFEEMLAALKKIKQ